MWVQVYHWQRAKVPVSLSQGAFKKVRDGSRDAQDGKRGGRVGSRAKSDEIN